MIYRLLIGETHDLILFSDWLSSNLQTNSEHSVIIMIWFLTKANNYTSMARLVKRQLRQVGDPRQLKTVKHVSAVTKLSATVTKYFIVGYCLVETFGNFVGWPASINGKSMQPTLMGCQVSS